VIWHRTREDVLNLETHEARGRINGSSPNIEAYFDRYTMLEDMMGQDYVTGSDIVCSFIVQCCWTYLHDSS
jgi:hypothetical protein